MNGSPSRVEGDAGLEFDADVKRPLLPFVDEGNIVVFGQQDSHFENTSTVPRIPMGKRKGVFVVQLDAQTGTGRTKTERFHEPNANSFFQKAEVSRSTNNTARQGRPAQGNLCATGDHSINKTKKKAPTERSKRDGDQLSNVDYVSTNTHSSQGESQDF